MSKILFIVGLIVVGSGFVSPPFALALGIAYGFSFDHPFHAAARHISRLLLQLSVVGLGFGMDLHEVLRAGRSGFLYTACSIVVALVLGWGLGKLLRVKATTSYLIATGTAICGGSAIAAISPIMDADEDEVAVSLGTIFILNSVALILFPFIGSKLHLSQTQFGLWRSSGRWLSLWAQR
jgi:uncharacterized membrane protein YadS